MVPSTLAWMSLLLGEMFERVRDGRPVING
jgi:hypothetical protein